jgi:hypothetical protein
MRYQLVIQADHSSIADYDAMLRVEQEIEHRLTINDFVDGHDAGSGEWNIFLEVEDPVEAWSRLAEVFEEKPQGIRVAYRQLDGGQYTPLFPPGLSSFAIK